MTGARAHDTEVFRGFDNATAKDVMPMTIDRDPRCQRIFRVHQPLAKLQPVFDDLGLFTCECRRHSGEHLFKFGGVVTPIKDMRKGFALGLLLHNQRIGSPLRDRSSFLIELRNSLLLRHEFGWPVHIKMISQCCQQRLALRCILQPSDHAFVGKILHFILFQRPADHLQVLGGNHTRQPSIIARSASQAHGHK